MREASLPGEKGFEPLTIRDQALFHSFWQSVTQPLSSAVHFSTLMAWSDWTQVRYQVIGPYLCLLCQNRTEKQWYGLPLLGPYEHKNRADFKYALEKMYLASASLAESHPDAAICKAVPFRIEQVKEWMLPYFHKAEIFPFQVTCDRNRSDYLYRMEDFKASLEKPKSRYDIRHFIKYQNPALQEFQTVNRADCFWLLEEVWCKNHACRECTEGSQKKALEQFLKQKDILELSGFVVYAKGRPAGYTGVVFSNREVIFQMKKNIHGIRGLSGYMHQQAVWRYGKGYEFVNYTEDMGRPGLRQYKKQLAPYTLSHNYVLTTLPG